jgi:hypothetical protein
VAFSFCKWGKSGLRGLLGGTPSWLGWDEHVVTAAQEEKSLSKSVFLREGIGAEVPCLRGGDGVYGSQDGVARCFMSLTRLLSVMKISAWKSCHWFEFDRSLSELLFAR